MNDELTKIPSGSYVIAVSGGVDSMVLLDSVSKVPGIKLVVAHFDHGIRSDSEEDRKLVERTAKSYGLPFVYDRANLLGASEAEARDARYEFLNKIKLASKSGAIITAHHQDDQMETAIFNIMRGTNRKGLSSMRSTNTLLRPLLGLRKSDLYDYARSHNLSWQEDSTNQDLSYSRNYIRHKIMPLFNDKNRQKFMDIITNISVINSELDKNLSEYLSTNLKNGKLNRHAFIILPHKVSVELMAAWLRQNGIRNFDSKLLTHLTVAAKTLQSNQQTDVNSEYTLQIDKEYLALKCREC